MASQLPNWLMSLLKTQPPVNTADLADKSKNNGTSLAPQDEVTVKIPLYKVEFGGDVEGVDYIPIKNPTAQRYDVTSPYGWRIHPVTGAKKFHKGIDLLMPVGTPFLAPERGQVITAGYTDDGGGRRVVLLHRAIWTCRRYDFYTAYFHLSKILCAAGGTIEIGQDIGLSGGETTDPQAGLTTGPHGHLETRLLIGYASIKPILCWTSA
jgi:murein DD-endopeptidase MepM/ murein hydrolase activator NlpD